MKNTNATASDYKLNAIAQKEEKEINQALTACALLLSLIAGYSLLIN